MKTFTVLSLLLLIFPIIFTEDYDPANCDWENNSDACFQQAQAEFDKEKASLDAEIEALQKQNDDVTTQINQEIDLVNQKVADLQTQMNTFQQEMNTAFDNMVPNDLMDELNTDLANLDTST